MEENKIRVPHNVIIEDRKKIRITGVQDVDSFDEETISVYTELGELTLKGHDLHINNLSVESGDLSVEGEIYALVYTDDTPKKEGFFNKVFR